MLNRNNIGFLIVVIVLALTGGLIIAQRGSFMEGFSQISTNLGDLPASYKATQPLDVSKWGTPDMVVTPGAPAWGSPSLVVSNGKKGEGVANILNREPQPVPLPDGELLLFANTPFKPECCPNTYSNSQGCACMTANQYNYLIQRGSNNIPYSEY